MPGRRATLAAGVLALVLCLVGLDWGLPSRFHPDEKADVVAAMVREHRLLPDSYVNPSLPLHLTAPVVAVQALAASRLPEPWSDPLLVARALSAALTALAVLLLGSTAERTTPGSGAVAAFLLALAPGVVNLGHFATPEPWVLAAATLVLWAAVRHLEGRTPAWALGAALGLAVSTKYTAAALVAPGLAAVWMRRREPSGRADRLAWLAAGAASVAAGAWLAAPPGGSLAAALHLKDLRLLHPESARAFVGSLAVGCLAIGGLALVLTLLAAWRRTAGWAGRIVRREVVVLALAAALGFLLGTPGALAEPRAFLSDLAFNAQTRHEYKGLVGEATSFLPYLRLCADALTVPVLAASLVGLALAAALAWRGRRVFAVLALAALAPYLLVASSGHRAMRFVAPALPAAAWLAALALGAVPWRAARRVLTAALIVVPAVTTVLVVRLFLVDSRLQAERWMEANLPPGATVDLIANHPGYLPRVPEGHEARLLRTLSREMAPAERFEEAARDLAAGGAPWLVTSGSYFDRFLDNPEQMPERTRFFRALLAGQAGYHVAARFEQERWLRPPAEFLDPEIVILRRQGETPP
ncbi:MAG TPA: glycosyltransferase family 39 protein [Vicinamibacteria bacterium]|nr:glycosyltransferase family 39 protein [Vicinamibacteria bacterium]